jgi:putative FmdB family regulatory protein
MIYEYQCAKCQHVQDEIHGMNELPVVKCEKCGESMKRCITGGAGFIFKGGAPSNDLSFKKSMLSRSDKQRKKAQNHVNPITSIG